MYTFEKSIFINRPQQKVWDFISNPGNNTQWKRGAISAEWTSEGPPGVGSTLREIAKFMGRTMEGTSEIIIWDPPNEDGQKKGRKGMDVSAAGSEATAGIGSGVSVLRAMSRLIAGQF